MNTKDEILKADVELLTINALIEQLANNLKSNRVEAKKVYSNFTSSIKEQLLKYGTVSIHGLGVFYIYKLERREAIVNKKGEEIKYRYTIRFSSLPSTSTTDELLKSTDYTSEILEIINDNIKSKRIYIPNLGSLIYKKNKIIFKPSLSNSKNIDDYFQDKESIHSTYIKG